ncbi:MAG: ATP-binding cassette domain-containing protein [Clostridiales bacterium]|jgi:NitT/TauT family transport system ATP-binding protein|nr:ATP-binding cassette domain-containing protein [Clostridiales bacterium]
MTPNLEVRHIYKNFGEKNIFTNFNLKLPEIGFTAIMGPSGQGKTTLINLILGLMKPDHGEIIGFADKKIAAVFQEDRLLEHKSGLDNILFVLRNQSAGKDAAWEMLARAGLAEDAHKAARDYSGGMRRRLALCRALVTDFDMLILDEPFKGLDIGLKPEIMTLVKQKCQGRGAILITHDRQEAEFFDSHIVDISEHPLT